MRFTAENLVKAIGRLKTSVWFEYVSVRTKTKVRVIDVIYPLGPILIERSTKKGERESISTNMLQRVANAVVPNVPINLERVLGASYNTRSALESLMAHTSEFYWCTPGRIEVHDGREEIKRGHKHLIWLPDKPHAEGVLEEHKASRDLAVSELPSHSVIYDSVTDETGGATDDQNTRHTQIQIALASIGHDIGYKTWIARNDRHRIYKGKPLAELEGVLPDLHEEVTLKAYPSAIKAASLIDCIWFKDKRYMPAVIEVEHSTGVTSGLTRMKKFQEQAPALEGIRWVVAAPDEDRDDVFNKAKDAQFRSLDTRFFPYSAIEELYSLCQRRRLHSAAVNPDFVECFMEKTWADISKS